MNCSAVRQRRFTLSQPWFDVVIWGVALLTGAIVWFSHGMTFDLGHLRQIWFLQPESVTPTQAVFLTMLVFNGLSALSIWLFCRVALVIGLGYNTVFLLFLLFNFNPEFNSVRLDPSITQVVIALWTLAIWLFLRDYKTHFYRAFLLWAGCMLCAASLEPAAWLWLAGFPLCFLFWPGSGHWWMRIYERLKFFCAFYALCALLITAVPYFRHDVLHTYATLTGRLEQAMSAMAVFISDDQRFNLAGYDAFLIAWVLVMINALKNAGLVIIGVVAIALIKRPSAVLPGRVWLFFAFSLGYASLLGALSLLYLGHLQSDLLYVPVTMLMLWMCASAVFYLYQRWRTRRMAAQHRLVLFWLMIAYAIASMIQFGTSSDYLRDGGVWAYQHRQAAVYGNSYQALFFAGESPIAASNPAFWAVLDRNHLPPHFGGDDLLLFEVSRRDAPPAALADFIQQAVFINRRGDRLFILTLPKP